MSFFPKKRKTKLPKNPGRGKARVANSGIPEKKKKKGEENFRAFCFGCCLSVFSEFASISFFSPFLYIDKITIEGNQDISSQEISKAVEKSLEGKYFNYLPQRNFFLASESNISEAVKNNFNRLEVASIEKKFPRTHFDKSD